MNLLIKHTTAYDYTVPVLLNVHTINLIPQARSYFFINQQELLINPHSKGIQTRLDLENNMHYQAWFEMPTNRLEVHVSYNLQLEELNPFGFILEPSFVFTKEGFVYKNTQLNIIQHYLYTTISSDEMDYFVRHILQKSTDVVDFLTRIVGEVHEQWAYEVRHDPGVWEPPVTFTNRNGSCRDLSWMLIHMLRKIGFATRFVSGYAFNPELEEGHELHAWLEVFLPGAGWVGLDPSLGLWTDHHYIPLSCHAHYQEAAPLIGTYGGTAQSTLSTMVTMQAI